MKVVIVEDEKPSAEHLALLLQRMDGSIEVVNYLDTVKGVVKAFQDGLDADLLFLDIHLADGNSFEIFNQIQIDTPIIFTTAYDQYAIQAFKQNSIDYLLKPIAAKDLQFALEKFKKQAQSLHKNLLENITTAYQQLNKQYKTRFLVKKGQTIVSIIIADIHHFETQDSLSFLVNTKGNRYAIDYSLDQLESMLNPSDFFRINRKIILHIQSIEKVNTYLNSRLVVAAKYLDSDACVVSRDRVGDFKVWLDA
jgi:DNA-binding LytR/AlgR family response regulator